MKFHCTICLLLFGFSAYSQTERPTEGAIKTEKGFLLYFNFINNAYTLELIGDIDGSHAPFFKVNDQWFEHQQASKIEFGNSENEIFSNYMKWEVDYINESANPKIRGNSSFIYSKEGIKINFWHYEMPPLKLKPNVTPVKKTYFMDLIHRDLVIRFSYGSFTGNDSEAKSFLLSLVNGIRFYKNKIDLTQLQISVKQGNPYYLE